MDNGNGTASLSGTTTASGTYPITITASNGVSPDATQSFTLTVNPPVTTWTRQSPGSTPGNLDAASMAYDPATGQQLLFGGSSGTNTYVNGTWTWNGTTWTQLSPATSPSARGSASMAYDTATGQMLLFGGITTSSTYLNDTWAWDGSTWTQLSPATSPPVRFNASMAYDPATSQFLLFGGAGSATTTGGDTWTWNGTTWTQLAPTASPSSRSRAMVAYDPATSQLVLFGGSTSAGNVFLDDTWTWNGATWSPLALATIPSARGYGAFGFDTATQQLVLFGGAVPSNKSLADTWAWTGTTWTPLLPATSPSARYRAASAYDPASSQFLLYGGGATSTSFMGDTWTYAPVPATAPGAPSIGTATAGNAQATVTFNPPSTNNGSAITSYTVTATDLTTPANGGEAATGAGSPLTVTGLTNGDSYSFSVTASNGVNTGAASSTSTAVTPATVPSAPTIGTATGGNAQASVTFNPPVSNGGATISSYAVSATDLTTPANGGQTVSGAGSPLTVTGLTNGDSYTFSVTAANGVGTGPASRASNTVVPVAPISITSVAPGQIAQGAKATVVITGTGYVSPVGVSIPGGGVTPSLASVTPTAVTITVKVSSVAALTARDVQVSDANGTATCTGCLTITPTPTLTSANPSHLAVGATGSVTFLGSGLQTGATVKITGPSTGVTAAAASIVVTASTLTTTIKAAAGTATGAYTVKVTNPDKSTATCTGCLTVIAAPTLASISPSSVARSTTTAMTLTGTGFAIGASLKGPSGVTFTKIVVVNSTTITATMKVSATATVGINLAITVTNNAAAGYGKVTKGVLSIT